MADIQTIDFSVNILSALLWQYNVAPNIQALLAAKQAWYDAEQTNFWSNWIVDVFDLRTCNDFGLVVWAIILGIPLTYILGGSQTPPVNPFGFGPDTIGGVANGNSNFFSSNYYGSGQTQQFQLTEAEKRIILQLRYRQLVSRGTVPEVNKILNDLLVPTYGPMYVIDNYNMTFAIKVVNGIPAFLSFLFTQFDLIPRPAGVKLLLINGTYDAFGFGPDTLGGPANGNLNFYNSDFTINPQ